MVISEARFFRNHLVAIRKITLERISPREYLVTDRELIEDIWGKKQWKETYICPAPTLEHAETLFTGRGMFALANERGNVLDVDGSIEGQHKHLTRDVSSIIGKAA